MSDGLVFSVLGGAQKKARNTADETRTPPKSRWKSTREQALSANADVVLKLDGDELLHDSNTLRALPSVSRSFRDTLRGEPAMSRIRTCNVTPLPGVQVVTQFDEDIDSPAAPRTLYNVYALCWDIDLRQATNEVADELEDNKSEDADLDPGSQLNILNAVTNILRQCDDPVLRTRRQLLQLAVESDALLDPDEVDLLFYQFRQIALFEYTRKVQGGPLVSMRPPEERMQTVADYASVTWSHNLHIEVGWQAGATQLIFDPRYHISKSLGENLPEDIDARDESGKVQFIHVHARTIWRKNATAERKKYFPHCVPTFTNWGLRSIDDDHKHRLLIMLDGVESRFDLRGQAPKKGGIGPLLESMDEKGLADVGVPGRAQIAYAHPWFFEVPVLDSLLETDAQVRERVIKSWIYSTITAAERNPGVVFVWHTVPGRLAADVAEFEMCIKTTPRLFNLNQLHYIRVAVHNPDSYEPAHPSMMRLCLPEVIVKLPSIHNYATGTRAIDDFPGL
jgi:hypothetical protein